MNYCYVPPPRHHRAHDHCRGNGSVFVDALSKKNHRTFLPSRDRSLRIALFHHTRTAHAGFYPHPGAGGHHATFPHFLVVTDNLRTGTVTFQGMDSNEQFQFYFRQHWIRLLWPFTRSILLSIVLIGAAIFSVTQLTIESDTTRHGLLLAFVLFFFLVQMEFMIRFYRHFLYIIVITDRKIHRIKKTFIAVDDHQIINLWSLQNIFKSQHGIIQNTLGFGTITLEAQETVLRLHFVPRISAHYESLLHMQAHERNIQRR